MKKIMINFLSLTLVISMLITSGPNVFAKGNSINTHLYGVNNVIVTDIGIQINGKYYSDEEFIQLLNKAQKIDTIDTNVKRKKRAAAILLPGIWFIPGVGQIAVTLSGGVIVAGVAIKVGSHIHNSIVKWFENNAVREAYENAKGRGAPTDNHSEKPWRPHDKKLPVRGEKPFSSKDLVDKKGVKQRRYYGENGMADEDIDYYHNGEKHTFPHRHKWVNGERIRL